MKNLIKILFTPILLIVLLAGNIYSQQIFPGYLSEAALKGSVEYSNFGYSGNNNKEVAIGIPFKTGSGNININPSNKTDVEWVAPINVTFSYNGSELTTTIFSNNVTKTTSYSSGNLGNLNYVQFNLKAQQLVTTVSFNNIKINSNDFVGNSLITGHGTGSTFYTGYIFGLNLTPGFTIEGEIVLTGAQPSGNEQNSLMITVGYATPPDLEAPVVKNLSITPDFAKVCTPLTLSATIDDSETGNYNIAWAEYKIDDGEWVRMLPKDKVFNSPDEYFEILLEGLCDCGYHEICVRGADIWNNISDISCVQFVLYELGNISGNIIYDGHGVSVIVKLLQLDGETITFEETTASSNQDGSFIFENLIPGQYYVDILVPLGFRIEPEVPLNVELPLCDDVTDVNFELFLDGDLINQARPKGYWKHQFDIRQFDKPGFLPEEPYLDELVKTIQERYDIRYEGVFNFGQAGDDFYNYWYKLLNYMGNDMKENARGQLAALLLNWARGYIHQASVVTADGRNVADVITEASIRITKDNGTFTDWKLARDIADWVNIQKIIPAGMVNFHYTFYKELFSAPVTEYALSANYPNPFNPSTVINFAIPQSGFVTLKVYDVLGKEVATLVNEVKSEGYHSVTFDAGSLTSGVYIYQIQAGSFTSSKKMILMK